MMCGCSGEQLEAVGERNFQESGERVVQREGPQVPRPDLVLVLVTVGQVHLVGSATGYDYGHRRKCDVFAMNREDYDLEKRVTRVTQDTLRLCI